MSPTLWHGVPEFGTCGGNESACYNAADRTAQLEWLPTPFLMS